MTHKISRLNKIYQKRKLLSNISTEIFEEMILEIYIELFYFSIEGHICIRPDDDFYFNMSQNPELTKKLTELLTKDGFIFSSLSPIQEDVIEILSINWNSRSPCHLTPLRKSY